MVVAMAKLFQKFRVGLKYLSQIMKSKCSSPMGYELAVYSTFKFHLNTAPEQKKGELFS
jgi:hypothetical protein